MHFHGFFCQQVSTEFQDISRKEELFALSFVIARECYLGLYCRTNKAKREQLNKIFILQRRSNSKKRSHSLFWSEREKEEKLGPIAARIIIISNPPKTDTFLPTARAVSLLHSKRNGNTLLHIKQETTLMKTLAPSGLASCLAFYNCNRALNLCGKPPSHLVWWPWRDPWLSIAAPLVCCTMWRVSSDTWRPFAIYTCVLYCATYPVDEGETTGNVFVNDHSLLPFSQRTGLQQCCQNITWPY